MGMKFLHLVSGPPCSGKSTFAKEFAHINGYGVISSGTVVKSLAKFNPRWAESLASGDLFPDEAAFEMAMTACIETYPADTIVIDGMPRLASQLVWLASKYKIATLTMLDTSSEMIDKMVKYRADQWTSDTQALRMKIWKTNVDAIKAVAQSLPSLVERSTLQTGENN